jgi:hypothetical protein
MLDCCAVRPEILSRITGWRRKIGKTHFGSWTFFPNRLQSWMSSKVQDDMERMKKGIRKPIGKCRPPATGETECRRHREVLATAQTGACLLGIGVGTASSVAVAGRASVAGRLGASRRVALLNRRHRRRPTGADVQLARWKKTASRAHKTKRYRVIILSRGSDNVI